MDLSQNKKSNMSIWLGKTAEWVIKHVNNVLATYYKSKCAKCGEGSVICGLYSNFAGLSNVYIGKNSGIPQNATIFSAEARLFIGDYVMFGPNPTIITGDHRIDVVGKVMQQELTRLPENNVDVIIENDIWFGANVTVLKGVHLGQGCVVAAGAVVTKSFPPYSIIGGVPAKVIGMRFSESEIKRHETLLYPNGYISIKERLL